jgi:hypothetical protein
MKRIWVPLALAFTLLLAPVVHTGDSDLVELSKKEKAKRAQTGDPHKVFTNKDIEAFKAKNKQTGGKSASSSSTLKAEEQPQTQAETSYEDAPPEFDYDKEKIYWRGRYEEAKARIEKAQKDVDRLQPIVKQLQLTYVDSKDPSVMIQFQDEVERKLSELQSAKKELDDAEKGMEELWEEGRKAGALPGWFRDE